MKAIGFAIGMSLAYLAKFTLRLLVLTGSVLWWITGPLVTKAVTEVAALFGGKKSAHAPREPVRETVAPVKLDVQAPPVQPEPAAEHDSGPATVIHSHQFEGCDRIVSMRLDPPVGVINLRIFYSAGVVKRDLIISEPHLKTLMKGRRHNFPDVPYDPLVGTDGIKEETIALAEKLINDLGNKAVKAMKPRKDDFVRAKPPAAPVPAPAQAKDASKAVSAPAAMPAPPAYVATKPSAPTKVVAPTITTGFTYVGRLTNAGTQVQRPPDRPPYEIFEATIQLDNGAELALRGAELERELTAQRCALGQKIAITPMGKLPVNLANGQEGRKNLYRVENLDNKPKG